jgi:exosortase
VGLTLALVWVWWPTLTRLVHRWVHSAQYSHGYLVPLFALYLLWSRRDMLPRRPLRSSWLGLPLLGLGLGLSFAGTCFFLTWLNAYALLPGLAGLCVLVAGGPALRWAWPAIAFLLFMVPLPFQLEVALAHPLQHAATAASAYAFQTLGFAAFAEGNVIRLGQVRIGVVEACSGLSMLVIFFALSTAVAILCRRSRLEKGLIVLSAIPIALAANVTRIVVTGILHRTAGRELADLVFHDLAGWLMMPLALALLGLELRLLSWILLPAPPRASVPVGVAGWNGLPPKPAARRQRTKTPRRGQTPQCIPGGR